MAQDYQKIWRYYLENGMLAFGRGQSPVAESMFDTARKVAAREGAERECEGAILRFVGSQLRDRGELEESALYYRRALRLLPALDDNEFWQVLDELSDVLFRLDRHGATERLYRKYYEQALKQLGPCHAAVNHCLGRLGLLYLSQGQWTSARRLSMQLKGGISVRSDNRGLPKNRRILPV